MNAGSLVRVVTCVIVGALSGESFGAAISRAPDADALAARAAWQPPQPEDVRDEVLQWLGTREVDEQIRAEAEEVWSGELNDLDPSEVLLRLARTFAVVDEDARGLVELCSRPRSGPVPASFPWLEDPATPPIMAHNLRLLYGRWLVQESLYDEAHTNLDGLDPGDVVDPASLLFYQAVACHRLLDQQTGLELIEDLLAGAEQVPRRYEALARLMQVDLEGLEEDTLDHIARRMEDVERRLGLGRAGPQVRKIEDGVIESLDKLIKELEDRQQQQQAGAGASNVQSQSPAQDSQIIGGKGPGEVVKRDVGSESGWGNLPPKERDETLQEIGREFPAHYRDVIEQYFRSLAGEQSQ